MTRPRLAPASDEPTTHDDAMTTTIRLATLAAAVALCLPLTACESMGEFAQAMSTVQKQQQQQQSQPQVRRDSSTSAAGIR